MAELTSTDRLQPCLLDRLTDEEPEITKESRDHRVVSLRRYRQAVLRDLEMLLNSRKYPPGAEVYDFPEVEESVLNYGIPDLTGLSVSAISPTEFQAYIKQAVLWFEPRIARGSLTVRIVPAADPEHARAILFEIEGELWAQPLPERLFVKTEVDLETGHHKLKDEAGG
ncbi:MAG: type VI secretion system baseplate subunit TssE [Sedimentisphaerales bacterium]|nr:type VI secretion system baseplate subunit TssE [Sedimentisphaerales bacterium]